MTKYLLLLLPLLSLATQITMEHAASKPLSKVVHTNAQITQLSDQKQEIVSRLSGHVEAYYVQAGKMVKKGDKVVLIESIELSKRTADFLALKQQIKPALAQVNTSKTLYRKGLLSKNELSTQLIGLASLRSQKNALASQLETLGIDTNRLQKATDKFILYAHADGIVGKILVSLHSNVDAQTPLMTLVNQSGYYATAYLSVEDAMRVNRQDKGWVKIAQQNYPATFVQLLPNIDEETQRAKVLFSIDKTPTHLLLGAFTKMDISLASTGKAIMVKKSALTLFQGEWVVFVEAHHDDEEEHHDDGDAHEEHTVENEEQHKEAAHEGHAHEDEEHNEAPYTAKVVQIIDYIGDSVAIEGLEENQEYVSDGVYFVKSMLLKSSLGGHGH